MKRSRGVLLIAAALAFASVGTASAQGGEDGGGFGGGPCGTLYYGCMGNWDAHTNQTFEPGASSPLHTQCLICYVSVCHEICTAAGPEKEKKVYAAIVGAAAKGDFAALTRLSAKAPGYVVFNAERQSVQVKRCDKIGVVVNLVPRTVESMRVARALPRELVAAQYALASR